MVIGLYTLRPQGLNLKMYCPYFLGTTLFFILFYQHINKEYIELKKANSNEVHTPLLKLGSNCKNDIRFFIDSSKVSIRLSLEEISQLQNRSFQLIFSLI